MRSPNFSVFQRCQWSGACISMAMMEAENCSPVEEVEARLSGLYGSASLHRVSGCHWSTYTADMQYHIDAVPHIHTPDPHWRLRPSPAEARLQRRWQLRYRQLLTQHQSQRLGLPRWPYQLQPLWQYSDSMSAGGSALSAVTPTACTSRPLPGTAQRVCSGVAAPSHSVLWEGSHIPPAPPVPIIKKCLC